MVAVVIIIIIRHIGFLPFPHHLGVGMGGISEWEAGEAFIHSSLQVFPLRHDSNLLNCSICKCYANGWCPNTLVPPSGKVEGGLIPQVSLRASPFPSSFKEKQMLVLR